MVKTVDRLESDIPMSAGEGALVVLTGAALVGVGYLFAWGRSTIRSMIKDREFRAQNPQQRSRDYDGRNGQQTRGNQSPRTPRPDNQRGQGPGRSRN